MLHKVGNKSKAFSLVEVLISLLIISCLTAGLYRVLHLGTVTYYRDMGLLDLQESIRLSMHVMLKELRQSSPAEIDIKDVGNTDSIGFFNPTIPYTFGIRYYLDTENNRLMREYPQDTHKIIANNIIGLNFILTNQLLEVEVTASTDILGGNYSLVQESKIYLRNDAITGITPDTHHPVDDAPVDDHPE